VDTAPKASGCILGGTQRFTGRNRESRRREAAGRRNYPEAVPKERERQKMNNSVTWTDQLGHVLVRSNSRSAKVSGKLTEVQRV